MVELVNNHVLFPNPANWAQRPRWQRAWQTEVADAVTASESRVGFRSLPRVGLSFLVTPPNQQEQARFDDRVRAAKKSGLACCPYHGRGSVVLGVIGTTIHVAAGWEWEAGNSVFLCDETGAWEIFEIESSVEEDAGWALDFAHAPTIHSAFVWPLLFGMLTATDMDIANHIIGAQTITITEQVSSRATQIGAVIPVAADEFALFKT